ncbi:MAG: response regulator transcription factor [Gammaproteobacteria bacterium]|jgi:two-component system response regulator PhoP|nr:response regulator transcription factor [Gammaproteobacteria bacterium]MDH3848934.1 response regulator transcription factor [Gammaproteobacteria bacterium]MDH3864585.1 response regulator transcription factor [Gammaproteobacteria bacterium]MDH3906727.1 response regulator transcription factor [Gammaproteobacteria bacterium]MDH4005310.1 response regulator transcription factor [Gammaproteobacteria bacterium]
MRLLVIEDDNTLRESLVNQLGEAGYAVEQAADGREGLYFALEYPVDLAIIDLGLPEISGLDIIREARDKGKTYPILILTARDRWQDKVDGLSAGADDYVVKPFHFEEVGARVHALLRRSGGWASSMMTAGPVVLDMARQDVTVDGAPVELTSFEYKIIEYLMLRAGQVISKTELTERLYDQDFERDSNVIEVFIGRLRKKLDPANSLKPIETLRGRGYRFALERNQSE